jgi:hypothetical protein
MPDRNGSEAIHSLRSNMDVYTVLRFITMVVVCGWCMICNQPTEQASYIIDAFEDSILDLYRND